jgi:hypothetical protein
MATSGQKPLISSTSSDKTSLLAAMSVMLREFELTSDQLLPAIVVAYDRANNIATVRPLIVWLTVDDKQIVRNEIANVPVLSLGGGGFHINFPLAAGDLGWIYAADRDLSLFKQTLAQAQPNTGRAHSFDDSMFVPDVFRNYTVNSEDAGAMVIQSTTGATRISIRGDNIKITAPSNVTISTPTTHLTGDLHVDGNTQITGTTTITGLTSVNGGFTAVGGGGLQCDLPATTKVNGKVVDSHGHIETAVAGSRTSGGMVS